jgi:hypothetical protein
MTKEPINTSPIETFIQQVKSADSSQAKEVKLTIQQARSLALTLGQVSARLHGDLEKFVRDNAVKAEQEVINVEMDGGGFKED